MPYIKEERRKVLGNEPLSVEVGDAAFIAYREAIGLLKQAHRKSCSTQALVEANYAARITIYGMLCGVAQEFWDAHVRPYEQTKRIENGDVE
jgi:hypothetical protein